MNERIQELAEQAEQYADDTMNSDPAKYDRPGQVKVWRELMQAKFAELIVRECTNMLPEDSIRNADGVHMFYVIRERFGVEAFGR